MGVPMRERAQAAGLSQTVIGKMTRRVHSTICEALGREDGAIGAIVVAWEIMSPEQRARWLSELGVEKPRIGRPRKS